MARKPPFLYRAALERTYLVLALAGMLLTLHIALWYGGEGAGSADPLCGVGSNCLGVIAQDPAPLGLDSAWWGFLFYSLIYTLGVLIARDLAGQGATFKKVRLGAVILGFLYSLFLVALQATTIDGWCRLCLYSALIVTAMMALLVFSLVRKPKVHRGVPARESLFQFMASAVMVLLLVLDYRSVPEPEPVAAVPVTPAVVNTAACRYDPDSQTYSNIEQLVTDYDPVVGPADAPVLVIEFLDPNCNHCKTLHPAMKALADAFPNEVRIVYKPVAIVGGPLHSREENIAMWLAHQYGVFPEMLDLLFRHQNPQTGIDTDRLVDWAGDLGINRGDFREGLQDRVHDARARQVSGAFTGMGFSGVPTVLIGGRVVDHSSRNIGCMTHFVNQELDR